MDGWYYIEGAQQVGPISEIMLLGLFEQNEISLETYVWKKGFPEWLRFKNVEELNKSPQADEDSDYLIEDIEDIVGFTDESNEDLGLIEGVDYEEEVESFDLETSEHFYFKEDMSEESTTPDPVTDFDLDFSWKLTSDDEEIFFLKIGRDRHEKYARIFGPYSLIELKNAYEQKRINSETLLIAPGMGSWVKIHNTPINELFYDNDNLLTELEEKPIVFLLNNGEFDLVGIVKDVKYPHFKMSCSKDLNSFENKNITASIFHGNKLSFKNISIRIDNVDHFLQEANCTHLEENSEMREFLLKSDL